MVAARGSDDQRRWRDDEMHSITERTTGISIQEPGDLDHQPASLFRKNDTTQIQIRSSKNKNREKLEIMRRGHTHRDTYEQ